MHLDSQFYCIISAFINIEDFISSVGLVIDLAETYMLSLILFNELTPHVKVDLWSTFSLMVIYR